MKMTGELEKFPQPQAIIHAQQIYCVKMVVVVNI